MQMVALITMEKPKDFTSENIKNEKVKVIKNLKIKKEDIILGQYSGYKNVNNVNPTSTTETFVYAKACIDNDRWKNVPIHLITGKMLDEKKSEIIINFKNDNNHFKTAENNKLVINVTPVEGVNFFFNVKEAGLDEKVVKAKLDYCHTCEFTGNTPEAYEKLLLDLVKKQNSLFTRWDEIENSWRIIDEIKEQDLELFIYKDYQELKDKIILKNKEIKNDI
jgi:glucose-6-phosphate 1-dehydrogenase